jgi:hypothetical protein
VIADADKITNADLLSAAQDYVLAELLGQHDPKDEETE